MAAITVQAEGRSRRIRMFVIAAVTVAALVWVGGLQLAARNATSTGVASTTSWKPINVSEISERGTLLHQKIAAAVAKLQVNADPTPVCLPCIARQHQN